MSKALANAIANPKLVPHRLKLLELEIGQVHVIPWSAFDNQNVKVREKPISNGEKSWLLLAREYGLECKRIE